MPTKVSKQAKKKSKPKVEKTISKERIFNEFLTPDEQAALTATLLKYEEAQIRERTRTDEIHERLVNEHRKRLKTATIGEDTCTHCGKGFVKFFNNEYRCTICKKKIDRFCVSFQFKDVVLCKLCQHNTIAKGTSGSWYFDYLKKAKTVGRISDTHPIKALSNSLERLKSEAEKHESLEEVDTEEEEVEENLQESPMKRIGLMKKDNDSISVTTRQKTETIATYKDDTKSVASVQLKEPSVFHGYKAQKALSEFNPKSFLSIGSNISSAFSGSCIENVQGRILVSIDYIASKSRLKIFVLRAENLVTISQSKGSHLSLMNVDIEPRPPNPYVKCYLFPEHKETKKKLGKQKTNIMKKTCDPKWMEELSYNLSEAEVRTKTLNCSIWHNNDRKTGKNRFIGEFNLDFDQHKFDPEPVWYELVPKDANKSKLGTTFDLGDITLAIKFDEMTTSIQGVLHVWVKSATNLTSLFNPKPLSEGLSPMVKIYLNKLGNKKEMKQKSKTCPNTRDPVWNNAFKFENLIKSDLPNLGVQIEVFNDKKSKSECISMCRLNLGTEVEPWMDAKKNEQLLWKTIIVKQNTWAEASIPLREFKS